MKNKIDLLIPGASNHFTIPGLQELTTQFFNIKPYVCGEKYDIEKTLLVINQYQYSCYKELIHTLANQQIRILIDNLQEAQPHNEIMDELKDYSVMHMIGSFYPNCVVPPNHTLVQVPMFFWIHDATAFIGTVGDNKHHGRLFNNINKAFLMMINNDRDHRKKIIEIFKPLLDQNLWSYRSCQKFLPNDVDSSLIGYNRYNNPQWYNETWCSVVPETLMNDFPGRIFITEKTFKPIQMKHPFVILGTPNSLSLLKKYGFTTYDNIFNESYDICVDYEKRIQEVYRQLCNVCPQTYDKETYDRMQHNSQQFYNFDLIKDRFCYDMVNPILEFMHE